MGCKRPSKNLWSSKTNDSSKQGRTPAKVSDALETAAVAQSVHGRKRGCLDWWEGMNGELKSKLVQSSLAAATKSEVSLHTYPLLSFRYSSQIMRPCEIFNGRMDNQANFYSC